MAGLLEHKADAGKIIALQNRVIQLVRNYRVRGHNIAALDPLGRPRPLPPELELSFYGFSEEDMDQPIHGELLQCEGPLTVRQILQRLQDTYCRSIGVQFMHIDSFEIRRWLQKRMEGTGNRLELKRDEQIRIFTRLTDAVTFEEFIRKKFVGAQKFFTGRMREFDSAAGSGHRKGGGAGRQRNRPGHGPSRALECAGQYPGQKSAPDFSRIRR